MTGLAGSTALLALAWFAAVNLAVSALVWCLAAGVLTSRFRERSGWLLAVRLLPGVAALVVAGAFVPSHWMLEPESPRESFGTLWFVLAAAGAVLLARSAWRAASVIRAERRFSPDDHVPGGVSLVGVLRTHIVIGAGVRAALTPAEFEMAIAHEVAHRAAFDNVKRCLLYCAPDFFGSTRAGARLEAHWCAAAETLADARAARGDERRALNLASALVKVAKLEWDPGGMTGSPAWSRLHDPPLLERRVRRLVEGASRAVTRPRPALVVSAGLIAGVMLCVSAFALARPVHEITEALVRWLP